MPVWSPDGEAIAFSAYSDSGDRSFWLALAGRWDAAELDLPPAARLVAWIE
jgi:hypothetical protein